MAEPDRRSSMMSLNLEFDVRRSSFTLHARFDCVPGETVAIIGPNGAGKTTLLKAIAGLVPVDDGSIRLDGVTLDRASSDDFVEPDRRPIGMVFQDYLLFAHMTALENVAFGLRARGEKVAEARQRAKALLESMNIADCAPLRPGSLSGGQQQRVALARALAIEPRVLLLDEPLAAIDPASRHELRANLSAQLRSFGRIVLLVTHDMDDVRTIADRVIVLDSGRVVWDGPVTDDGWLPR